MAVGETTMDAFIRLKDASVHCDINNINCQICMAFGAKIPYESVTEVPAVGNAANASVAASRLGLKSALVANVGKDRNGETCLKSLKEDGVSTEFINISPDKPTNYHYIIWFESERTILQKHSDFDYKLPKLGKVKWVYLTSLGEKSLPLHAKLIDYLRQNPETKLAFQPGIFQIKMGVEKLREIYARSEVFFSNVEEAQMILDTNERDIRKLSEGIHALGPRMVSLSDGTKGAYLYLEGELWHIPMYPDIAAPLDRTGAGDAFSSTFAVGLVLGLSPTEALTWGPINSMSVVQEIGAQKGLLTRAKLEEYLQNSPAEYKTKKIN